MLLTAEQIQGYQAQHGRVAHVIGKDSAWECVFRKPSRAEYKRFRALAVSDNKAEAQEWLATVTAVFPDRTAFEALLDNYPGIPEAAAGRLAELAGLSVEETGK